MDIVIYNISVELSEKYAESSAYFLCSRIWKREEISGEYLLWTEVKKTPVDIFVVLTQLVLTIGNARIFDKILPTKFLGRYDNEKNAFLMTSPISRRNHYEKLPIDTFFLWQKTPFKPPFWGGRTKKNMINVTFFMHALCTVKRH
jgi:hypothetical protein